MPNNIIMGRIPSQQLLYTIPDQPTITSVDRRFILVRVQTKSPCSWLQSRVQYVYVYRQLCRIYTSVIEITPTSAPYKYTNTCSSHRTGSSQLIISFNSAAAASLASEVFSLVRVEIDSNYKDNPRASRAIILGRNYYTASRRLIHKTTNVRRDDYNSTLPFVAGSFVRRRRVVGVRHFGTTRR